MEDDRARRYSAVKTRVFIADIVLVPVLAALFWVFLSLPAAEVSFSVAARFYPAAILYSTFFYSFLYFLGLPLHFFSSFRVEREFSLSTQTVFSWLKDEAKSFLLGLAFFVLGAVVFYLIVRNFRQWWLVVSAAWFVFSFFLARIFPVLVIPIFFKYSPLENADLKRKLRDLAARAGIRIFDVCRIDASRKTRKANAALVGMGSTRRVILSDTLAASFDDDEIASVVAHEFGHHKYAHMPRLILFSAAATFLGFFLLSRIFALVRSGFGGEGSRDLEIFPVIFLLGYFFNLVLMPLYNFYSRCLERKADGFAVDLAGDPSSFIRAMEKLAEANLSEREPSAVKKFFMYDHPPIGERIKAAKEK